MVKALVVASIVWLLALGGSVWAREGGHQPSWTSLVYLAASRVCHQRPERSFHTAGVQWPVCARCSGLYLAAPVGAIAALSRRRPRADRRDRTAVWVVLAALPTAITLALEWLAISPSSNLIRLLAALPLGATIAFLIVRAAGWSPRAIGYTG